VNPTVAGYVTALSYLLASYLCYRVYRRLGDSAGDDRRGATEILTPLLLALAGQKQRLSEIPEHVRRRSFWLGLALVLGILGICKPLNLLTAITAIGRKIAFDGGWYGRRRRFQEVLIGGVIVAGLAAFRATWALTKGQERRAGPAVVGIVCLLSYVGIRAVSLHDVDTLLRWRLGRLELSAMLELAGIALVVWSALRFERATEVERP
jgi:hypothetical protein